MAEQNICVECFRPALCDGDGVCKDCFDGINANARWACAKCWDLVDKPGSDLCDWCAMTPEQRRKRELRMWLIAAAWLASMLALAFWG